MTGNKAGGTGVPPVQSFQETRRNLPHLQEPGSVYFITWRCRNGEVLAAKERQVAIEALRYWDRRKWTLYAAVAMPDHVHALVRPLTSSQGGAFDLAEILHSVKSFSAHQINLLRNRTGAIWQDERYDRIVRDDAEFLEKWQYIKNNPVKQGLVDRSEDYPWLYEKGS